MKRIKLSGKHGEDKYALVDDTDFDYLNQWKWHLKDTGYAVRRPKVNGKNKTIYMHRLIMNTPDNLYIDHINRNRLDNRRSNLINVTWAENRLNISKHKDNVNGHKNIDFNKTLNKWRVRIQRYKTTVFQTYANSLQEALVLRNEFYGGKSKV